MAKGTIGWADTAVITVVESAANTLTYKKLETGVSIMDRIAWIINRIEWFYPAFDVSIFNSTGDGLTMALTLSSSMAAIGQTDSNVVVLVEITRRDFGTAANAMQIIRPWVQDFSALPGGGLVVLPNPIYLAAVGVGLAGATTSGVRLYYTSQELSDADYVSLINARRLIAS